MNRFPGAARVAVALAVCAMSACPIAPAAAAPAKPKAQRQPLTPAKVKTGLENLEKQVREFTLPNGMKFLVVERRQAPVFSYFTVVDAGSSDENVGTTGLAHMMEHMAFKGTQLVGTKDWAAEKPLLEAEERAYGALLAERRKGARADSAKLAQLEQSFAEAQKAANAPVVGNESTRLIEEAGGQNVNAFTATDITAYFYSLPSNRLDFWAALHAGAFVQPVFREFYKERDVVQEERRMRSESSPIGRLIQEYIHASYVAHPYGFGGIGHMSDLKSFSRTQGEEFFRRYYVAKNLTTAVVGDVSLADVRRVAETYFSAISDAEPPPPPATVEPPQNAERRVILEDPAQPVLVVGWKIPGARDPSYAAFKAAADLLAGGNHARLVKKFVKERKSAVQVGAFTGFPGEKYPNQLILFAIPASGQDPEALERELYAELDSTLALRPFTTEELNGYQVRVRAQKIAAVESNGQLAGELAQAEALYGDWREFFREQERVQSLTPDDLAKALKPVMVRTNRTVGIMLTPKPGAQPEGGR